VSGLQAAKKKRNKQQQAAAATAATAELGILGNTRAKVGVGEWVGE